MIIGVPRERKKGERRVAMTPDGVRELVQLGSRIVIEKDAGLLSAFSNEEYKTAGAQVVETLEAVWTQSDLIIKVKEPAPEEVCFFRPGLSIFCFFHLAVFPELCQELLSKKITSIDYDLVMLDDGRLPILEPMSIIAGKLAIQLGVHALQAEGEGRGVLLGGCPGVPAGKVVVLGAGSAGSNATKTALGVGADVSLLDVNPAKLAPFSDGYFRARTLVSSAAALERELQNADLVVGAVLIPGALAPKLITRKMLSSMRRGAVIVDISIDQGGIAESSRTTSIAEPAFNDSGIIHYGVPNMPAMVPRTSTWALTNATLPWLKTIATQGVASSLKTSVPLKRSLITYNGHLTNERIGEAVKVKAMREREVNELLSA